MKKILAMLLTLLLLTACVETIKNDYAFTGESEHWEAEYSYQGTEVWGEKDGQRTYSNEDHYEFVLKFIGSEEELHSIKKVEYSYKTISEEGSGTTEYTEPINEVILASRGSSGGAKVREDEVIQVTVKWNDFEESFELHNKSE